VPISNSSNIGLNTVDIRPQDSSNSSSYRHYQVSSILHILHRTNPTAARKNPNHHRSIVNLVPLMST
jgi:hypothetical protein